MSTDDNAVPQDASDSLNSGPPGMRNIDWDESPVVREATAIIIGHDPNEEERLSEGECKIIKALSTHLTSATPRGSFSLFSDQIRYPATSVSGSSTRMVGGHQTSTDASWRWRS